MNRRCWICNNMIDVLEDEYVVLDFRAGRSLELRVHSYHRDCFDENGGALLLRAEIPYDAPERERGQVAE